jgi:tRNA-Thr(GGU) m(6)t(6)A37 methyltransferase TsaA
MHDESYHMYPIGFVRRKGSEIYIDILEPYRPGLVQLDQFSHVMVFWWADKHDTVESRKVMQTQPPYAPGQTCGVFATRAEYRPNPIAMTTCKIESVDPESGKLVIVEIDAFDGTGVVDLKAYFPVCDRIQEFVVPDWVSDWPEWMPEEGIGL